MNRKISVGRKLSTDMHRKLSAISNCSDISNLSFKLGMDPEDFKSTVQNILGEFTFTTSQASPEHRSGLTIRQSRQRPRA